ncbi:MAG TPA: FUSC family protein [Propionibacteriaceae bacterium]|nr:FUSC family protein [Propionibacteriaceae bacterium]
MARLGGLAEWFKAKDPGLVAVKRAGRVSVATCIGFYFSLYVVGETQMAFYASFGCIDLGALSEVTGEPRQRTKTYLAALVAGIVLVTVGTMLAFNTWAAAAGMLVVGFAVAYAGAGGPRVLGAATGLELLYILPSFPPYAPESLGWRLIGLVLAVALLAIADRLLWPPPIPTPFPHRLAEAISDLRDRLAGLVQLAGVVQPDGKRPSPAEADSWAINLRLSSIPTQQRPTGPGRKDRAAMDAATLLRGLEARVVALTQLTDAEHPATIRRPSATLLDVTVRSLGQSAETLAGSSGRGDGPEPDPRSVDAALSRYLQQREALAGSSQLDHDLPLQLRLAVIVEEIAIWTRDLAVATKIIAGGRIREPQVKSIAEPFWYATRSTASLWYTRLRGHLTPRSVFFQNAIRLALGLAAARLIAGLLDLSHGFWVLLATLTLMRTSVAATRAAVVPAFVGTVIGGLLMALVLGLAGANSKFYVVAFPVSLIIGLAGGRIAGPIVGQASFTLMVALLFAQIAPVTWRLAEVRITDVVLGGLLGAVIGLLVWPRGATGEMRRIAKASLDTAANDLESTVRLLIHREMASADGKDSAGVATHSLMLAASTLAQYRSELRSTPDNVDWLGVLALANEVVRGGQALRRAHDRAGPLPWPAVADELDNLGQGTADQLREIADLVSTKAGQPGAADKPAEFSVDSWLATNDAREVTSRQRDPAAAVRVLDVWGWLAGVSFDGRQVAAAVTSAAHSSGRGVARRS